MSPNFLTDGEQQIKDQRSNYTLQTPERQDKTVDQSRNFLHLSLISLSTGFIGTTGIL